MIDHYLYHNDLNLQKHYENIIYFNIIYNVKKMSNIILNKIKCNDSTTSNSLLDLDKYILEYMKSEGWVMIKKYYIKCGKTKLLIPTNNKNININTNVSILLEFLSSYRKIIIDYIISRGIYDLTLNSFDYKDFLQKKTNSRYYII